MAFDAFSAAEQTVNNIEAIVGDRISQAVNAAESARTVALATIGSLTATKFTVPVDPPAPPSIVANIRINSNLPPIAPNSFGVITSPTTTPVTTLPYPLISSVTIPVFTPSIDGLTIPNPPSFNPGQAPSALVPDASPTIPTSPNISLPVLDALATISIPAFTFPVLPTFDTAEPTFVGSALPATFAWAEPTYASEILDEVFVVIRRMFAGGSGLPAAIEQAIFERANDREDQLVARAVQEAYTEWSDRGFTTPPGMLNARVDDIRQDALLKKQGANRELSIKIADIEVENLRFAVTQALAAEQVLVNIFLNSAERMFQAAKYQIQALVEIYNAQIGLFNARQIAYQTAASVYKTRLEASLSELEVFKAQVQGELAKAQINESVVKAYLGKVQALMSQIEIYKAQMQGAQLQVEVSKTKVEAYKANVEAYAARVNAEKVGFDAYSAQIQGEAAKANIVDAQARAYAAQIQGIATGVTAQKTAVEAVVAANETTIKSFVATVERDRNLMQYQLSGIQSAAAAYTADTQRFIAVAEAEKMIAQLEISSVDAQSRNTIALYTAVSAAYNARMEQLIREASLAVEGLKSAGQIATTLAASAYAAVHVGATLNGGGSLSAQGSESDSYSRTESTSTNTNYNFEGT